MPALKAARFCSVPGCHRFAASRSRCSQHAHAESVARYAARGHLYGARWRRESAAFLSEPGNDRCRYCGRPAELVDHSEGHGGDPARFWRRDLWVPACLSCNSRRCVEQEGGFGNAPARVPTTARRPSETESWG